MSEYSEVVAAKARVEPILQAINDALQPEVERLKLKIERCGQRGSSEDYREACDELLSLVADAQRHREMVLQPVIAIMNSIAPTPIIIPEDGPLAL